MTYLLQAKDITIFRNAKAVVDNVSLSVEAHDFITIVGPNGAGKSTLLQCLLKFFSPDKGSVQRKKGLTVGYIPQQMTIPRIMPLTVQHFLSLRMPRGFEKSIHKVAHETGITPLLHRALQELSGGETRRVLLARALVKSPDLLVLDEPTQNLDIKNQLNFYDLLRQIYETRPVSILMASHDLHLVMNCTKKVVCLFHHVCCSGTPKKVVDMPEFQEIFGHDMTRMMALVRHHHDHHHEIIPNT